MRMTSAILSFVLALALTGCGGSPSTPTTPSPATPATVPTPGPVQLAVFSDPASDFSTSDVRDVQEQIVRFDMTGNTLIWAADGRSFSGYPVSGNFLGAAKTSRSASEPRTVSGAPTSPKPWRPRSATWKSSAGSSW